VERNKRGKILTGPDLFKSGKRPKVLERDPSLLETNIPGVFAIGDVRYGSVKRVASGVGVLFLPGLPKGITGKVQSR
jgi:thioredoxin reductase (NADPH)